MAKCDCNNHHHDYDPVDHHHPKHPPYMVDRCADECDDQLPLMSQVGRGLRGDSYRVEVAKDGLTETILEGLYYDEHSGAWVSDWFSKNINGGHLSYQYNLRPFTDPQTFTITFKYVRPGREADENGTVWSWTTPAIPYLWSRQEDGSMSDGEDIVGSGVATLYLKKTTEGDWPDDPDHDDPEYIEWLETHEKLVYPDGFTHKDMHAPDPLEGWTVNLQYGIGGDIDAPNIDDIAKILGITKENVYEIIQNSPVPTDTIPDENLKKYIDRRDKEDFDHIHKDMGFPDGFLAGDGGTGDRNTIKKYIDGLSQDIYYNLGVADPGDGRPLNLYFKSVVDNTNKGPFTTVKEYIDARVLDVNTRLTNISGNQNKKIDSLQSQVDSLGGALEALFSRIYGASLTVQDNQNNTSTGRVDNKYKKYTANFSKIDGKQSSAAMIPMGNINVLSSAVGNAVLTHDTPDINGDVKAT